jgi:hypothetical protein
MSAGPVWTGSRHARFMNGHSRRGELAGACTMLAHGLMNMAYSVSNEAVDAVAGVLLNQC